jgi:phosphoglucosamine mutase
MNKVQFGTDGIRGRAGQFPIDRETIQQISLGIINLLSEQKKIAIARDTRESGKWILDTICSTLVQHGVTIFDCGILPTAALACNVLDLTADIGIMITASHNPWEDNGIKLFNSKGAKLSDNEQHILQNSIGHPHPPQQGSIVQHQNPQQSWLQRLPKIDLSGWNILLDCAHGALSPYGEEVLRSMGANVVSVAASPTGNNINQNVGALHPPKDLGNCDIALCFDGDADRIIMVTPNHGVIDGDDYLWLLRDQIDGPMVGTIMSNGGLDQALEGRLQRSKVGDKNVANLMKSCNALLGAEPSGHVIFIGDMPAGDGLYAALRILKAIEKPPININWSRWPTAQTSIRFEGTKIDLNNLQSIQKAKLSHQRLVVRYSGTEPKLRILVEGDKAEFWCNAIAHEFQEMICQNQ